MKKTIDEANASQAFKNYHPMKSDNSDAKAVLLQNIPCRPNASEDKVSKILYKYKNKG